MLTSALAKSRLPLPDSGAMVVVAIVAITLIAVGSTWMRMSHLDSRIINETAISSTGSNPFATGKPTLPDDIMKAQREADAKVAIDAASAGASEARAAFILLAVIFVVTQIVAIYSGVTYGFAGDESKAAFKGTRGFAMYEDYVDHLVEPVIRSAQSRLQELQRKLAKRPTNVKVGKEFKTFDDYLSELARRRDGSPDEARPPPTPAPAIPGTPTPASLPAPTDGSATPLYLVQPQPAPSAVTPTPAMPVPDRELENVLQEHARLASTDDKLKLRPRKGTLSP